MYEHQSFDAILQRMLARVPDGIDKREGSVIYDACAPAAAELAQMYIELDINRALSFADTATGEELSRRTAEFGVNRLPATFARRRAVFADGDAAPVVVPLGSRFGGGGINYRAIAQLTLGEFVLEAETPGVIGNQYFGALLPIDYIAGLVTAELGDVIAPGADEETDAALRSRYYATINEPAFGGNVADYKIKIGTMAGVGAVKVYPAWDGGGTVKCTIIASDWMPPSPALVDDVQVAIDPDNGGLGIGLAPIGHTVTIAGAVGVAVDVETILTLASGVTVGMVQDDIEMAIDGYLQELRQSWAAQEQIVVRIAQMEARILSVPGVEDIAGTEINEQALNLTLTADEVPLIGTVILDE